MPQIPKTAVSQQALHVCCGPTVRHSWTFREHLSSTTETKWYFSWVTFGTLDWRHRNMRTRVHATHLNVEATCLETITWKNKLGRRNQGWLARWDETTPSYSQLAILAARDSTPAKHNSRKRSAYTQILKQAVIKDCRYWFVGCVWSVCLGRLILRIESRHARWTRAKHSPGTRLFVSYVA